MKIVEWDDRMSDLLLKFGMPVGLSFIAIISILIGEYKEGFGVRVTTETIGGRPAYCAEDTTGQALHQRLVLNDTFFGPTPNLESLVDDGNGNVCYLYQDE